VDKRPIRLELSPINLSRRGVPKKFHKHTIEDFDDYGSSDLKKVKDLITNYINTIDEKFENNEGLFMYGANGVGKTLLASIVVKEAYRHRYTSKRVTFNDYIKEYTRVWGVKDKLEREALEEQFYNDFKAVEFLVLEEIGKEIDTKITAPILEDCLRYREERGLVSIICTNIEPKLIVEKYGNSIGSLIKGNFLPIKIIGSDKRKEKFDEKVDI
jgi:DNA replication protein DnaC